MSSQTSRDPSIPQDASSLSKSMLEACVQAGQVYHVAKKSRLIHNARNLGSFFVFLATAATIAWAAGRVPWWVYLPTAAIAFGLLFFGTGILVIHEASHNMFLVGRDREKTRFWNRLAGWSVCVPLGIDYHHHWERGHMVHHREPLEEHDPQNCPNTVLSGRPLMRFCLLALLVPGYIQFYRKYDDCPANKQYPFNPYLIAAQVVWWGTFVWLSLVFSHWTAPVAAFLGLQVLSTLNQIKIAMEHGGPMLAQPTVALRSCSSFFPLRRLLMPLNISLHFEHHLNFCVPWYDLPKYHRDLRGLLPDSIQQQVFRHGRDVLKVLKADGALPRERK